MRIRLQMLARVRFAMYLIPALIGTVYGRPALGQTRFEWPVHGDAHLSVNVKSYNLPEACQFAVRRIHNHVVGMTSAVYQDTIPYSFDEARQPISQEAQQIGKSCAQTFAPEQISLDDMVIWVDLFLKLEQVDDAKLLVARRFDRIFSSSSAEYAWVSDTLSRVFVSNNPMYLAYAESLATKALSVSPDSFNYQSRVSLSARLARTAWRIGDSTRAVQWAHVVASNIAEFSISERGALVQSLQGMELLYDIYRILKQKDLLDSLKLGTDSYVSGLMDGIKKQFGIDLDGLLSGLGVSAKPLSGQYWFESRSPGISHAFESTTTLPAFGKISLIVFLNRKYCNYKTNCHEEFALLRRLKQRYPDLDLILVGQTFGWFGPGPLVQPDSEAKLLAKEWLEFFQIPATLVVSETPHFFLPGFDKRRINEATENAESYSFGQARRGRVLQEEVAAFLIDKNGKLVTYPRLVRQLEGELHAFIDALMRQGSKGLND